MTAYKSPETKIYNTILAKCQYPREASSGVYFARKGKRKIKSPIDGEIASRWDANLLCDICRHFASVMLHFASLITHNLRCIPAYAHLIPTGFFQSLLNYHRDNMYIIPFFCMMRGPNGGDGCFLCFGLVDMDFRQKCSIFWRRMKKGWGSFSWGSWCDESGISFEFLYYK